MRLRSEKEEFVTGHSGTTIWEIQLILIVTLFAYVVNKLIYLNTLLTGWKVFCVEYLILIIPFVISMTFVEYTFPMIGVLSLLALLYRKFQNPKVPSTKHESFIVAFRAYLQLLTITAILAVDFHVFPRRFAKTETVGTSLMDVGVGCFVFSSGLVQGPRLYTPDQLGWARLKRTIQLVIPCLVLGFGRAFATKMVDYQEHVSEYGTHWNFFITLGLLPVLTTIQHALVPRVHLIIVGVFVLVVYQGLLFMGLQDYILHAPRIDLISGNREGICSLFGFYGLFLLAGQIGKDLLSDSNREKQHTILFRYFCGLSGLLYVMMEWLKWEVSRRMVFLTN